MVAVLSQSETTTGSKSRPAFRFHIFLLMDKGLVSEGRYIRELAHNMSEKLANSILHNMVIIAPAHIEIGYQTGIEVVIDDNETEMISEAAITREILHLFSQSLKQAHRNLQDNRLWEFKFFVEFPQVSHQQ